MTLIDSTMFTGSIGPNQSSIVRLDSVSLLSSNNYSLKTILGHFNNQIDQNPSNDTLVDSTPIKSIPIIKSKVTLISKIKCNGDTTGRIAALVTGGKSPFSYRWSNGSKLSYLDTLSSAVYSLTVTDAKGCIDTLSYNLTQPDSLQLQLTQDSILKCNGDSDAVVSAIVKGGIVPYRFLWSNQKKTSTISNLDSGKYLVEISDSNNCKSVDSIVIEQPKELNAKVDSLKDVSCKFGKDGQIRLNVSGGTLPYLYTWNNGRSGPNEDSLSAGKIEIIISDSNNCSVFLVDSISAVHEVPLVDLGNDTSACPQQLVTVDAHNSSSRFLWNTGETTQTITPLFSGLYSVIVTDSNNCEGSDTLRLAFSATCVGIAKKLQDMASITYYPNPNNGQFMIRVSGKNRQTGRFNY